MSKSFAAIVAITLIVLVTVTAPLCAAATRVGRVTASSVAALNVRWQHYTGAQSSSPILAQANDGTTHVLLSSDDGCVRSIQPSNGYENWKKCVTSATFNNQGLCAMHGTVYATTSNGALVLAFDIASGTLLFNTALSSGSATWFGNNLCRPDHGIVIVPTTQGTYGVNGTSGKQLWLADSGNYPGFYQAAPASYGWSYFLSFQNNNANGDGGCDNGIVAFNVSSGVNEWCAQSYVANTWNRPPTPIQQGSSTWLIAHQGGVTSYLVARNREWPKQWTYSGVGAVYNANPLPIPGTDTTIVGSNDGRVAAVDMSSQTEIWQTNVTQNAGVSMQTAPVLSADGHYIFIGASSGVLYALRVADGVVVGSIALNGSFCTGQTYAAFAENDSIIVTYNNYVAAIGLGALPSFAPETRPPTAAPVTSPPTAAPSTTASANVTLCAKPNCAGSCTNNVPVVVNQCVTSGLQNSIRRSCVINAVTFKMRVTTFIGSQDCSQEQAEETLTQEYRSSVCYEEPSGGASFVLDVCQP